MRLLDVIRGEKRSLSLDDWAEWFTFGGNQYGVPLHSTLDGSHEEIGEGFTAFVNQTYKGNGVVFGLELTRIHIFSEARFAWQRREQGRPQQPFTDERLEILERPWPGGTTQDLLMRMLLNADFGGNGFVTENRHGHLRLLRPDWMTIVRGSDVNDPEDDPDGVDAHLVGYLYKPGGRQSDSEPVPLLPGEVAHFAPVPDPLAMFRGMSWITPLVREISSDSAMTLHKKKFLENAATPNLVVTLDASVGPEAFEEFVKKADERHKGVWNAWKTMYLGGGADITVAGSNFEELDFKVTQGHGETRIAQAARIHPVVAGLSEGMQGSSLNAGNYAQARRNTADTAFHPLWRNAAGSLSRLLEDGTGEELVADTRDVPFLRQDEKDAAQVRSSQASTINSLISQGFTPDSAVAAVTTGDFTRLEHTGLVSVQLQPPGRDNDIGDDGGDDG